MPDEINDASYQSNSFQEILGFAENYCKQHELQFTPVRRKVLEILLKSDSAIGAYAILDQLREAGFKSQPPVAYRALDFLLTYGFAHKIEQLNAFVACVLPGEQHSPAFMICRNCDAVSEMDAFNASDSFSNATSAFGFKIEEAVIEAKGLCGLCSDSELR